LGTISDGKDGCLDSDTLLLSISLIELYFILLSMNNLHDKSYKSVFLICKLFKIKIIHTYHSRFIPEEVAEAFQKFLRDAHVLPKLLSYEEYCIDRW
jgi:hypothetical protein